MRRVICVTATWAGTVSVAWAGELGVTSVSPARNMMAPVATPAVEVGFNQPIDLNSVNDSSFRVFGRNTGVIRGTWTTTNGGATLRFTPNAGIRMVAGDMITVSMSRDLRGADSSPMRNAGYHFQFMTPAVPATVEFTPSQSWNVDNVPGEFARIYGGQASDLNGDGLIDLAIVCENSSDIRVYMNQPATPGIFGPRVNPSATTGLVPSPNDAGDFNNDGLVDMCTGNYSGNNITVLMGNGNGTFSGRVDFDTGGSTRGLAAQDYDGDGDIDIIATSPGSNRLAMLVNNGAGVFSPPIFFQGGGNAEYGLAAADFNNDGIFDLAVGNDNSNNVTILRGNGDGTFQQTAVRSVPGGVWVLVTGDVNGDGNMDVASANSFSATSSILRGNGDGTIQPAANYNVAGHTPATDLADVDGDGDLDMLVSSFGGGEWTLFRNNGTGTFTFWRDLPASNNPACALTVDVNGDRAIDLVLLDEIGNTVNVFVNELALIPGDMNCDGVVTVGDIGGFVLALTNPAAYDVQFPDCDIQAADINGDGSVSVGDIGAFVDLLT